MRVLLPRSGFAPDDLPSDVCPVPPVGLTVASPAPGDVGDLAVRMWGTGPEKSHAFGSRRNIKVAVSEHGAGGAPPLSSPLLLLLPHPSLKPPIWRSLVDAPTLELEIASVADERP